jgi:hypothetical protein
MAALWKLVGLRDVRQSEISVRMDFESFNDLWEPWFGGQGTVGAYLAGLDDRKRNLIEHHTRQAYLVGRRRTALDCCYSVGGSGHRSIGKNEAAARTLSITGGAMC